MDNLPSIPSDPQQALRVLHSTKDYFFVLPGLLAEIANNDKWNEENANDLIFYIIEALKPCKTTDMNFLCLVEALHDFFDKATPTSLLVENCAYRFKEMMRIMRFDFGTPVTLRIFEDMGNGLQQCEARFASDRAAAWASWMDIIDALQEESYPEMRKGAFSRIFPKKEFMCMSAVEDFMKRHPEIDGKIELIPDPQRADEEEEKKKKRKKRKGKKGRKKK